MAMILPTACGEHGASSAWLPLVAMILLLAGCRGGSISGAAGDQVGPTGGPGTQ